MTYSLYSISHFSFIHSFIHRRVHTHLPLVLIGIKVLTGAIAGLGSNLLVVLLEGGEILTGLGELTLFHSLSDVPVHEGTLHVHEVELVVDTGQSLGNGGGIGNHAHGTLDIGNIASRHEGRGLVVDSALESGGAPVNELDGALRLDGGNGGVDVLGDNVSAVHEAARHVLSVAVVALGHHVGWLKDGVGDLGNRELLVVGLGLRDDGRVGREHEVDAGVRDQVGLELGHIHVQGSVETKGGGQGRDDLRNEAVQVGVGRGLNAEVATADIVQSLVVKAEGAVRVLKESVGGQDGVVRLNDGRGDLGGRGDREGELGLAAIVNRQALEEERSKTGSGSSSSGVEDEESLQTGAAVGELADAVEDHVDNLLSSGVVTTGVVVGGILLTVDDLLRVVELTVGTMADLVTHNYARGHYTTGKEIVV